MGLYFLDYHLLPYDRIGQIFADMFDASLSPGTLFKAQQDAADGGLLNTTAAPRPLP